MRQFWTPTSADSTLPADPGDWGHLIGLCTQTGHTSPAPQLQAPDPFTLLRAARGGPLWAQLPNQSHLGSHNAPRQGLIQFLGWGAGSALAQCPCQAPSLAGHPVTHRINRKTTSPPNLCPRHNMSRSESCTPRGHASLQRTPTPPRGTLTGSSACLAHQASQAQTPSSCPYARLCCLGGGRERGLSQPKAIPCTQVS